MNEATIRQVQLLLGVKSDGIWGRDSQSALDSALYSKIPVESSNAVHAVKASSFADPADIAAFRRCKAQGKTDEECFKVGDNGIGLWLDDVTGSIPACALPPEDMEERWGSVNAARHKLVEVSANDKSVTCVLKDRMPHRANIKNGAGIDLNPAAVAALGMQPPIMISAKWKWV